MRVSKSGGRSDLSIDSIALNATFEERIHALPFSDNVHRTTKKRLQIVFDVNQIEQTRLHKVNNNVNISEVAYRVGFSSHSHFSNSFRDFFGMTPKEFITYYTENEDDETLQKLLE